MNRVGWDGLQTHFDLARLLAARSRFRMRRTLDRLLSPRRLVATSLATIFFVVYLLNGIFILSAREPADPERLRLWLSGGMVIYAIYHCLRCAWSSNTSDLELSDAESLWLGGAPLERSSIAVYHVGAMLVPTLLKTLLLAVVLSRDVQHLELLIVGVASSLVLLEISRLIIVRWAVGFDEAGRRRFRIAVTLIAFALAIQLVARVVEMTPAGSPTLAYLLHGFQSLGELASSDVIQWMSLAWIPAAHLAVTDTYQWLTVVQILASFAVLPLAIWTLVRVDALSSSRLLRLEQQRLHTGRYESSRASMGKIVHSPKSQLRKGVEERLPHWAQDAFAILSRQWVSVVRYRGTIIFSFLVPTLLCLSPLVTGQVKEQWFYVVGGIALCTTLLAPPALRIDFRRDLRRMLLLRSLPVQPLSMVLGQITLPVAITCVFQWITIAIAALVTRPGWDQAFLWTGILNALAVFIFAAENALFLAYPHHERSEGVAMMVRAKLTFLGKGSAIVLALSLLVLWALLCRRVLPPGYADVAFVGGAIVATWGTSAVAIAAAIICWRRFNAGADIPPQ